jgi:hypothetical protein
MLRIPQVLLCDEFRNELRSDLDFSTITHKSTRKKERKIADAMTQLLVNTCDRFERHKDYPLPNVVKLSRQLNRSVSTKNIQPFHKALTNNGFVINHNYRMPTKDNVGTTKSVIIPYKKLQVASDYLEQQNLMNVELNEDVLIDWNEPHYFGSFPIPNKVRINTSALKTFSNKVKNEPLTKHLHDKWNLHLRLSVAQECDGWMKQDYRTSDFGRLVGTGISSLQTMPKILLKEILAGCYEIDVNASAMALLPSIYNKHQDKVLRFPCIKRYIEQRSIIRKQVSISLGVDLETVKQGFTSIAFGVRRNTKGYIDVDDNWQIPTMSKIFGSEEVANSFINHKEVNGLWNEMSIIFSGLSKISKSSLPNLKSSQRVAYLYQTNEAEMLKVMMEFVGKSLVITKHDSIIISSSLSIYKLGLLEHRIYNQLGFKVRLSQGLLCP